RVQKVGDLVFIGVPGLFQFPEHYRHNFLAYLEYQHLYHFHLYTLERLMARFHYELVFGNEIVRALFQKVPEENLIHLQSANVSSEQICEFLKTEEKIFKKNRLESSRRSQLKYIFKTLVYRLRLEWLWNGFRWLKSSFRSSES